MKYVPALVITHTSQLLQYKPQRGQWIKLAWLDKPSRYYGQNGPRGSITAFHYPNANRQFGQYHAAMVGGAS